MARHNRDDIDKLFDYDIYVPTRTLYVGSAEVSVEHGASGVDEAMAERAIKGLHILDKMNNNPITIELNTFGGSVVQGFAIYDSIKSCASQVHIIAKGDCSSMGTIIFQAGDKRILAPHVTYMIHIGENGLPQAHPTNNKRAMKWDDTLGEYMMDIYLAKIREKHPLFTKKQLSDKLQFDTYLKPQEAIDLGLADELLY